VPILPIASTYGQAVEQGPYWIEYFCPSQSPYWQRKNGPPVQTWSAAVSECHMIKPRRGLARVLNGAGAELYRI
jgi:hypothetical protein